MADTAQPGDGPGRDVRQAVRLTVDELARTVGMSPRNIRAHQARRLLPPPVRQGRTAYYHAEHIRRLEAIKSLQRQGFNLVAVQAILGVREAEPTRAAVAQALRRLAADRPNLVRALHRYGVVVCADGGVRVIRPRVLRSALHPDLGGREMGRTIELLVDVLGRVQLFAEELVRAAGIRLAAMPPSPGCGPAAGVSWESDPRRTNPRRTNGHGTNDHGTGDRGTADRGTDALVEALAGLLTEAFRAAVERSAERVLPHLMVDGRDEPDGHDADQPARSRHDADRPARSRYEGGYEPV